VSAFRRALAVVQIGVARETGATLVLNAAAVGLGLALTIFLSRSLGAAGFGAYAYAFAWAGVLSVPAVLGLTPVLVRNVAVFKAKQQWAELRGIVRRSNQAVLAVSVLLVGAAAMVELLVVRSSADVQSVFLIGLALVPLLALSAIRLSTLQALGHVVLARLPETVVAPGLFLASAVGAAAVLGAEFSPSWAIGLQAAATLAAFGLGVALLIRRMPAAAARAVPRYETRAWARSAAPLLLVSALSAINLNVSVIALGATSEPAEVGVYGVAGRIAIFTSFLTTAAMYSLMPLTARLFATGERDRLRRLLPRAARALLLGASPIALAFLLFPAFFLGVFGDEFHSGATALRILVLGEVVKIALGSGSMVLAMTGNERQVLKGAALGAGANVVLVAALVPRFGAEGAAVAQAVSGLLSNLWYARLVWARLGFYTPAVPVRRSSG
jgi:O-antigen/teichoic acid export membrane protein